MSESQSKFQVLTVDPGITEIAQDVFAATGVIRPMRFFGVPHRMTILRIPGTQDLVVYSPFDPDLIDISHLGTVKAIIAPNSIHSTYPQQFLAAHRQATLYSSAALKKRIPDRDWGTIVDESTPTDIISPQILVRSITQFPLEEIVVLHVASGTVLVADLAFNLNSTLLAKAPIGGRVYYTLASSPKPLDIHSMVRSTFRPNCDKALPQLTALINDWEWDRMVPCHGDVVHTGAKQAFREGTYRFVKDTAEQSNVSRFGVKGVALVGVLCAVGAALLLRRNGFVGRLQPPN